MVDGQFFFSYVLDSGCETPIFSYAMLDSLQYDMVELPQPLVVETGLETSTSPVILAKHECTLREFKLTTRVGPLIVSNVRVLLVDYPSA